MHYRTTSAASLFKQFTSMQSYANTGLALYKIVITIRLQPQSAPRRRRWT
jgi:hypothetical protein